MFSLKRALLIGAKNWNPQDLCYFSITNFMGIARFVNSYLYRLLFTYLMDSLLLTLYFLVFAAGKFCSWSKYENFLIVSYNILYSRYVNNWSLIHYITWDTNISHDILLLIWFVKTLLFVILIVLWASGGSNLLDHRLLTFFKTASGVATCQHLWVRPVIVL